MTLGYISSSGRHLVGRDKRQLDYYKVIDWQNRLYYLVADMDGNYKWVRCFDWGKVVDHFMSNSDPRGDIEYENN